MSTLTVKAIAAPVGYDLAMPAGHILQVVQGSNGDSVSTTSTSWVASTLTATITPSSTSSKILVHYSTNTYGADGAQGASTIYRDSTELTGHSNGCTYSWKDGARGFSPHIGSWLDSPSSTSALVYKIYFRSVNTNQVDLPTEHDTTFSSITLMEVAG